MLYDIAKDQLVPSLSPHMDQSCKMKMFTPQSNYDEEVVPEDKAVQQIIQQEMKYKRELWRLEKVLRRGLASDDPLPVFNRRHLLLLVKRLCKDIESSTSQLRPDMDISRVSQVLESATTVSHGLICIAYADTLHEIREFLKREMTRTGDSATCFCHELHAERSLLPLHRLKYLKSLTCLSSNHNDVISSALDGCYVAISSLHSQSFVAEIDSLLDFALNMDPPPSSYFSAIRNAHIYQELISNDKSTETLNDHVYEEIGPYRPKKKRSFFSKNKPSKYNKDVSAQEEFLPLTNHIMKIPEIFA